MRCCGYFVFVQASICIEVGVFLLECGSRPLLSYRAVEQAVDSETPQERGSRGRATGARPAALLGRGAMVFVPLLEVVCSALQGVTAFFPSTYRTPS